MDQKGENHTTSAQEPTTETDVLIVGAGPTGLTLACELLRRGIHCCLIDRLNEPTQTSRAFDIQSRTLEVFDAMGMVEKVLEVGMRAKEARVYEREAADYDVPEVGRRCSLSLCPDGATESDRTPSFR